MKKSISTGLALLITALVMAQPKTIYLNSKTITCDYYGKKKECLQYKNNLQDTAWKTYNSTISGFTYNPGYFYTLQVQQLKSNMPQWRLVKVVSKTKSTVQQLPGDSVANTIKPPAGLMGQWNFSRLLHDAGEINFSPKKEMLRFSETELKITGQASCNSFFGNYTVDSTSKIKFEAIGHTMMACQAIETENKLMKAMELINNYSIDGSKLYLKADDKILIELTRVTSGKI